MLVLTRGIGEDIVIAGNIRVRVVAVHGQIVRLGVSAPSSVPVVRQELIDRRPAISPATTGRRGVRRENEPAPNGPIPS